MARGPLDAEERAPARERAVLAPPVGAEPLRNRITGLVRLVAGVVLSGAVVVAVVNSWGEVRPALGRIGADELLPSGGLVLIGLGASVMTWRIVLRELGSSVAVGTAAKVYLVGQLGKYVPGSVWALALQMELAREAGVPRTRGMAASLVAIAVNVVTGLAIGLLVVPGVVGGGAWRSIVAAVFVAACALALTPPVLTRLVDLGLGVMRRPPVARTFAWRGIIAASAWSVASWVSYGVSLWLLATAVGAPAGEAFVLCIGAVALAMTLGFLVVIAPSGIGVREAIIVAALAPVLDRPEALAVALVGRLLFSVADLVAAAAAAPVRLRASQT